jgi:hypothetical protein
MKSATLMLGVLTIGMARAQVSGFAGPVSGYIFDPPTWSVRAVVGSLGSATLGAPLVRTLEQAWIAPHQNYGIGVRDGKLMLLTGLGGTAAATVPVPGVSGVPDGVAWSDDGATAILYSRTGNWIQILTGVPNSVQAAPQIATPGSLSIVASDPHGQHLAIGAEGNQGGVYQVVNGQVAGLILQPSVPVGLTFSPDGNTIYALDQATNQIFELNFTNSALQIWPAGVENAIAIRASADAAGDNVLYVAGGSSQVLVSVNTATRQPVASVPLSFVPAAIQSLGPNSFLLAGRVGAGDTIWTFVNTVQPSVYFVPSTPTGVVSSEVVRP